MKTWKKDFIKLRECEVISDICILNNIKVRQITPTETNGDITGRKEMVAKMASIGF